jgi:hypothetical protein
MIVYDDEGKPWEIRGAKKRTVCDAETGMAVGYRSKHYLYNDAGEVIGRLSTKQLEKLGAKEE